MEYHYVARTKEKGERGMYCRKCGKQIDDDSTFCPFCGQNTVDRGTAQEEGRRSVPASGSTVGTGLYRRKMLIYAVGMVAAVIAVALVVMLIVKLAAGGRKMDTLPERLFEMDCSEVISTSYRDIKRMLDEEGTFYETETQDDDFLVLTKTPDTFLGHDCIYAFKNECSSDLLGGIIFMPLEINVLFENMDEFKKGREQIDGYMGKGAEFFTIEGEYDETCNNYIIDCTDGDAEEFLQIIYETNYADRVSEEYGNRLSDCHIYKWVMVTYRDIESNGTWFSEFPGNKPYIDYFCEIKVLFMLKTEEEYIAGLTFYGYDGLKSEEIDVEGYKASVDKELRSLMENEVYGDYWYWPNVKIYMIYMMEEHGFDMNSASYIKTEEEKKIWYITNFKWDIDSQAPIDLSGYRNSSDIYCAEVYNYDVNNAKYFESDLDRALFLADRGYNPETGEAFYSQEEKRLWFMLNYEYDITVGKPVGREVKEALVAYIERYKADKAEDADGMSLIYLNDDDIPECIVGHELDCLAGWYGIYSYIDGKLFENSFSWSSSYAERKNVLISVDDWRGRGEEYSKVSIDSAQQEFIVENIAHSWIVYDGNQMNGEEWAEWEDGETYDFNKYGYIYEIEGNEAGSEEEVSAYIDSFEADMFLPWTDELFDSVLEAYDAVRTTTYGAYWPEIVDFDLSNGVLTFSSDGGSQGRYGWYNGNESFHISYPVAEDCIWEHMFDNELESESDYEFMRNRLKDERQAAEDYKRNYGEEAFEEYVENPFGINVVVEEGVIVSVSLYTP